VLVQDVHCHCGTNGAVIYNQGGVVENVVFVRYAFSTEKLHSRMPLRFTPLLRLKRYHACDQWHVSRVSTLLPVDIVNAVQTLKVWWFATGESESTLTMNLAALR
jgi:hypothetical protein